MSKDREDETPVVASETDDAVEPNKDADGNGKKRSAIMLWAKAAAVVIPAVFAGVVSVLGYIKGDDAEKSVVKNVDSLVKQLNERVMKHEAVINTQSDMLQKMARRMVFFQGHQEGFSAGKLYAKTEQLQQELDAIKARRAPARQPAATAVIPEPAPPPTARVGEPQVQSIPRLKPKMFKKEAK